METFKLHPEQREIADAALSILKENNIVYLAMEMRTGKTPTSMTIAKEYGAKKVLFVTKLKAISGIQEMATHFDFDLTITNYESTHKVDIQPDLVILDEAHCLGGFGSIEKRKGHFTKPYQALVNLCRQKPIIYLSGTPSPESYTQLYFQFYLSSYSPFRAYSNFYKWAKDYVNAKEKRIGMRTIKCYDDAISLVELYAFSDALYLTDEVSDICGLKLLMALRDRVFRQRLQEQLSLCFIFVEYGYFLLRHLRDILCFVIAEKESLSCLRIDDMSG